MSNELNLNDLGLGDNSQSAINEKMPRRGAEGRGQSRESRKSLSEHDTARKPERVPMYAQRTMIDTTLIPKAFTAIGFLTILRGALTCCYAQAMILLRKTRMYILVTSPRTALIAESRNREAME